MKKAKFTEEQIARILQEGASGQTTQAELCRQHGISQHGISQHGISQHGISQHTFYIWKRKYGGMETEDVRRLTELERENAQLKRLLAERDLEVDAAKQLLRKNGRRSRRRCAAVSGSAISHASGSQCAQGLSSGQRLHIESLSPKSPG